MSLVKERLKAYVKLTRLDKPIGNLLLLWPTFWAVWIAGNGKPSLKIICIFLFGGLLMRAAGCAINDFADRKLDRHVKRTADRPLATGADEQSPDILRGAPSLIRSYKIRLISSLHSGSPRSGESGVHGHHSQKKRHSSCQLLGVMDSGVPRFAQTPE